jgi:hypothetical protein
MTEHGIVTGVVPFNYFFTPPVVVQGIAMGACSLGDRVFLAGRYRLPVLDEKAAKLFMELYKETLLGRRLPRAPLFAP